MPGTALDTADPAAVQPGAKPIGALTTCTPNLAGGAPCDPWVVPGIGVNQRSQDLNGQPLPNAPKNKLALNANYTWRGLIAGGDVVGSVSYIYRDVQYGALFKRTYNKAPDWSQVDARMTWTSKDSKDRMIVYVKNLFNNLQYDAGAFGNRFVGSDINPATGGVVRINNGIFSTYSVAPPRTYGVEFQHKFF